MPESGREKRLNRDINRTRHNDQNYYRNPVRYERFNQREDSDANMLSVSSELYFVEVVIGDVKVLFLLDSGAVSTVIDEKVGTL